MPSRRLQHFVSCVFTAAVCARWASGCVCFDDGFGLCPATGVPPGVQHKSTTGTGTTSQDRLYSQPFLSVSYQTYRFPVYKSDGSDTALVQYYYPPLGWVNPRTAAIQYNILKRRRELTFSISMWDQSFTKHVHRAIENATGSQISQYQVRLLPILWFRLDADGSDFPGMLLAKNWTSYASQANRLTVKFVCEDEVACRDGADALKNTSDDFVRQLTVSYSLTSRQTVDFQEPLKLDHTDKTPGPDNQEPGATMNQNPVTATGMVMAFYSNGSVPLGWLACDGAQINCSVHQKLCATLGSDHTPDLNQRFLMGSLNTSVGSTGGEAQHTLTLSEMPAHFHTYSKTVVPDYVNAPKLSTMSAWSDTKYSYLLQNSKETQYYTPSNSSIAGNNQPHQNLPPYTTVKFIIKT